MKAVFGSSKSDDDGDWLSVSDLMAGLMVIFLFIAIIYIRPLAEKTEAVTEIVVAWQESEEALYLAMEDEFKEDLPKWNAEIDPETLAVRFKSPEILFKRGSATIETKFELILADFFPRYVSVLAEFQNGIEEIRIEGHTSSDWSGVSLEEAYFRNMELSQARTREVLRYLFLLPAISEQKPWLRPLVTANGLSSSQPILDSEGAEAPFLSRRVEFRVRTKVRNEIMKVVREVQ